MWRKKTLFLDNWNQGKPMVFYLFLYQKTPGYWQNSDFTNWSRKIDLSESSSSGHEPTDLCQPIFLERYPPEICYISTQTGGFMWFYGKIMGIYGDTRPGYVKHSYWKWSIEIMDLPIDSMVLIFRSFLGEFTREIPNYCVLTRGPGHDSVQLVHITPIIMVYGTYNYS